MIQLEEYVSAIEKYKQDGQLPKAFEIVEWKLGKLIGHVPGIKVYYLWDTAGSCFISKGCTQSVASVDDDGNLSFVEALYFDGKIPQLNIKLK